MSDPRDRETKKLHYLCDLISEVIHHHFHFILFVRFKLPGTGLVKGRGIRLLMGQVSNNSWTYFKTKYIHFGKGWDRIHCGAAYILLRAVVHADYSHDVVGVIDQSDVL